MKLHKLTKTDEFSSVFSFRKRVYGGWLIANIKPNGLSHHRYGLVVSKKVSKQAVKRNYMKRVLRHLLQQATPVTQGCDVVVQVKKAFVHEEFSALSQEVSHLLGRIHKLSTQGCAR